MTQRTLLLDVDTWDLVVDSNGDIAIADAPYSYTQDAISAMRLFMGEHYYDMTVGVPYLRDILGKRPPVELITRGLEEACLTVPGIASAKIFLNPVGNNRLLSGTVVITDIDNQTSTINL